MSYEWRLDGELLNVKAPSYTFNSHKIGLFELTFSVIDNKTGVKYSASTDILVRSPYQRGWVVLSDVDGKSTLSFIKIKTLYGVSETVNIWGEKVVRDSIAYHSVEKYLVKDLGMLQQVTFKTKIQTYPTPESIKQLVTNKDDQKQLVKMFTPTIFNETFESDPNAMITKMKAFVNEGCTGFEMIYFKDTDKMLTQKVTVDGKTLSLIHI